jgi:hypothetical protein
LDDANVLDLAFAAKNGAEVQALYHGDTAKYNGDDSAADMALARNLAFWCGPDPVQIERLMRRSKLVRAKWDERRGDGTYLTYTIGQVLKDQAEFYTPPAGRGTAPTVAGTGRPSAATAVWSFLSATDLAAVDENVHVDWVIRGLFARGHVTLMPGIWKSGKTTFITHAIKAVGESLPFCGLDVESGPVTIVSEESKSPWRLRIASIGLGDYVDFLLRPFPKGRPTLDQWIALVDAVAAHAKDRALVVIDSIHNLWGVEQENDNAEQLRWLDPLHAITDAGPALLLAGHPSKAPQMEGRSTRGGGAIGGWACASRAPSVAGANARSGMTSDSCSRSVLASRFTCTTSDSATFSPFARGSAFPFLGRFTTCATVTVRFFFSAGCRSRWCRSGSGTPRRSLRWPPMLTCCRGCRSKRRARSPPCCAGRDELHLRCTSPARPSSPAAP